MEIDSPQQNDISSGRRTARKYLRTRLFVSVSLFAIVALSVIGSIQTGDYYALLAPGELSSPHAQLWQGSDHAKSCNNCHPGIGDGANDAQVAAGLATSIHPGMSQQQACAACHGQQLNHLLRGTPHDLPVAELAQLGEGNIEAGGVARFVSLTKPITDGHIDWHNRSFQCNDCHREHQGRDAWLAAMDSAKCQACHQKRFDSFEHQHSQFTSYPLPEPSPAFAFNHRSHANRHFPKQQTSFDCNQCHVKNEAGVNKLVRTTGFEAACASCHREPLSTTLGDGVVVWQLPSIDVETLSKSANSELSWPEMASAVTDLELSPLMRQLLVAELAQSKHPLAETAISRVAAAENLSDLALESNQADETVILAATASQAVLHDIVTNGQEAIKKRLKRLQASEPQRQYETRLVDELAKGMPPDLFDEAYRNWFGTLSAAKGESSDADKLPPSPFLPNLEPPREIPANHDELLVGTDAHSSHATDSDLLVQGLEPSERHSAGAPPISTEPQEYDARKHLKAGGWMIDRVRNAIVYIPGGHADRWMQAYAEWLAQSPGGSVKASSKEVISRCLECHTSASGKRVLDANTTLAAAWRSPVVDPKEKKLTRFDHRPHLTLPQLRDCTSCHVMNELPGDPTRLVSVEASAKELGTNSNLNAHSDHDFRFMSKSMCIKCHNAQTRVQSCTLCHDYHVAPK